MGAKLISLRPFSSSGSLALCIRVTSGSMDLPATSASKVLPYPSRMSSPPCSAANDTVPEANTTGATAAAPSSPAKAIAPSRRSPEPLCIPLQGVINQSQRHEEERNQQFLKRPLFVLAGCVTPASEGQPQLQLDYASRARRDDATKVDPAHVG